MLSSDEREGDLFFDSVDCLSSEGSSLADEELDGCELEYRIWMNEPISVKERRERFLQTMGLVDFASRSVDIDIVEFSKVKGMERIMGSGGAVASSSLLSSEEAEANLVCCERGINEANSMVDDDCEKDNLDTVPEHEQIPEACNQARENENVYIGKKKMKRWQKLFAKLRKIGESTGVSELLEPKPESSMEMKLKVSPNKKRCMEFTGVYMRQKIQAHKGFIWTMKFSPDGQYLASGGEDGVVRIWRVTSVDASFKSFSAEGGCCSNSKDRKLSFGGKKLNPTPFLLPDKLFHIEESPLQEFHGHSSDVLDLAWSTTNCLLSSSKDKTARLWQVGSSDCLGVFYHSNYVTCVQFNPVNENYFISGSIDGKVRIWGVQDKRVVDWANIRDVISAISYQPDGNGFVVGTIRGTCCFFEASGCDLQRVAELQIAGRKKMSGNKITGIQYSKEKSDRLMIASEDSKIRIFDQLDIVCKFKGLPKSGSQASASFTSNGKHIVSVGKDSRVYVWNYDDRHSPSSKPTKSVRSCEHFFSEGVSVAVPWHGMKTEQTGLESCSLRYHSQTQNHRDGTLPIRDSDRFSLGNWFSIDSSCRGSATWPEEKLCLWDAAIAEDEYQHFSEDQRHACDNAALLEAWGLVIVTAGWDGTISTFHNYGLPMRL
ncbi:general transcriptional corepressor tupA [Tripterygium wilfordii]|uniref:General transcriptional corepressor tupA n=1 Tax=Tripterygium wilfordii TaxID=458696 RepID=A0A7J7DFQ6_TRIWF|nr:2-deoxy-glucose resistant protein 2-like [Tripterygium wilfordii]XP_038705609.1 2-deoxy-glucose resistant protein 2-like [Tripterygium wilfordii]XP_038705610.1 2-deoxy-glucose resistant protein 2-like [Tripterygium wilfordii]XP_038705611.1 2-deoxy-glucose resistant protein 2-like [Tripterygium wilfordii]XP_038705612.1 2-deoxy-glucose resistant protein 2-like [Tripterygium wilfordii]XP_038705613.1 2-deoxy-glucose resistant protein 2-like [Tripterygium wilfordii]XP_038705615.1 2-deoxy-glucos